MQNPVDLNMAAMSVVNLAEGVSKPPSALSGASFEQLLMREATFQTQMQKTMMSLLLSVAIDMRRIADGQEPPVKENANAQ